MSKLQNRGGPLWALLLVGPLLAHVNLLSPNGGVTLVPGTQVEIRWQVQIQHVTLDWDLWYSVSGPGGPWIPIAMDLPAGNISAGAMHSYVWTVPAGVSTDVRFRVRQDNVGQDYDAISGGPNQVIAEPLSSSPATISGSVGGLYTLNLAFPTAFAGDTYIIAGSVTGTSPSTVVSGLYVPLVADWYTDFVLGQPNPLFTGWQGTLDATGAAVATLQLPPNLPPSLIGLTASHAVVVLSQGQVALASNAVTLTLDP